MSQDERTDRDFAEQALAQLDPAQPSAALLRRVARIPLDLPAPETTKPLWASWGTRALLFGALGLGVLTGVVPWEGTLEDSSSDGETELESTLSAALGSNWADTDLALWESL
jgi:hypothetical protein